MRKIAITSLAAALILLGAGCSLLPKKQLQSITLEYWCIDGIEDALAEPVADYSKLHPNITVNITSFPEDKYAEELIEAMAEDRGPDIFRLSNTELRAWESKLLPMPKETQVLTPTVDKNKQIVVAPQKSSTISIKKIYDDYVEAVGKDAIWLGPAEKEGDPKTNRVWGLPLSLGNLALFYNKDLLKKADVESPPTTWRDFNDQAKKLTVVTSDGKIKQSGAALGISENVRHNADIVMAVMGQNKATLNDANGYASFNRYPEGSEGGAVPPGAEAVAFLASFAVQGSENFMWDETMPDSLEAFVTGKLAFYLGLPGDVALIRERAPGLDFGLSSLPQVDPSAPLNIAHYPVETVSKKTAYPNESWDLLNFLSRSDEAQKYLLAAKFPTALRSLIRDQITNPDVMAFSSQLLVSESWYYGEDYAEAEDALAELIDWRPTEKESDWTNQTTRAVGAINSTY
jgi:ABC-type glycerol-3-phosphate transport system substrate-binding protein